MSMRSPEEGPRKGLLFFRSTSAPTQERPSGVVMDPPKPHIEVEPKPQFQPQPEPFQTPEPQRTKKSLVRRLAQNLAVRLGFATLALSGSGYVAYQEIPAVHRTVDNVIGKVFGDEVPSTYDNKLDKGVIGDNNIVRLTQEEIEKLPKFDEDGKPILLFPFTPAEGQTITFTKELGGPSYIHPGIEVNPETTRNTATINVKAGLQYSLFDGYMFRANEGYVLMIDIGNRKMQRIILGPGFAVPGQTEFLVDAPSLSSENRNGKEWEKGLFVSRGQRVAKSNVDAEFNLAVIDLPEGPYGSLIEGNLNFAIDTSGKLATSQG